MNHKSNASSQKVTPCVIWYYLYNLKNVKNTHGEVLLLVKLQADAIYFVFIITEMSKNFMWVTSFSQHSF